MSDFGAEEASMKETSDEFKGLPAAVQSALLAHPTWKVLNDGAVVCAGLECGWKKPSGKGPKQAWLKHQTYTMTRAVIDWYYSEEDPS